MYTEKDLKKTTGNLNNSNQIAYPKPYDERQMAIRGKAYQYGFISMIAYYALLMMLHDLAFENGLLSIEIMPMILGVFFLYICIMVGIKKMLDKERDHDEKSETESGSSAS